MLPLDLYSGVKRTGPLLCEILTRMTLSFTLKANPNDWICNKMYHSKNIRVTKLVILSLTIILTRQKIVRAIQQRR